MIRQGLPNTMEQNNAESRKAAEEERKNYTITFCMKHQRYHNKIAGCVDCREKRSGYGVVKRTILKVAKKIEKKMTEEKPPRKSNQDHDEYYGIKKKEKKNDTK